MTNRLENFTFKTTIPNRLKDFSSKTGTNRLKDFKAAEPGGAVSVADPNKPLGFVEDIVPAAPGMAIADPKDVSVGLPGPSPIGIRESVTEEFTRPAKGAQYVPGLGGVVGTAENLLYIDAGQRLKSDFDYKQPIRPEQLMPGAMGIRPARYTSKAEDQKLIDDLFMRIEKQQRGYTFGGKVAKGLLNLPTWMAEFAMTGGLASLGSTAAKNAGVKLMRRYATTKAGQIALRGMGWMGGAITRATLGLAPRITQEFTRRRLPEQFTINEQGKVVDFKWPKEKPFTSFAKAWGGMVIASASEEAGKAITGIPVALLNKTKFGSKFINVLRRGWMETTGGTAAEFATKMLQKGGYSNILGEYGEEGLEALLLSATGVDDFGAKEAYEKEKGEGSWDKLDAKNKLGKRLVAAAKQELDPENVGVRLAVLSTPMAGRVAIGLMTGGATEAQIKERLGEQENDVVEEIKSEAPTIEEEPARQLARQHIADQIEHEKVVYDELLRRHFEGDKKATEDLNNLVQEFHLPTYEAYLQKINQASDYYAEYIQEGMVGRGPVKPKSIKSFIAPKEGMAEIQMPPTETGAPETAPTRGYPATQPPVAVRPERKPPVIPPKAEIERPGAPQKTIAELQVEIDGYLKAQKNPPTELLAEINAARRQQKAEQKAKRIISEDSYKKAKKRLTDRNTLRMGIDPQGFIDLATIGAYHIESGLRTFGKWSQKMVEEFGDKIKPDLKKIWKDSRQIANTKEAKRTKLKLGIEEFISEDIQPTVAKAKKAGKSLTEIGLAAPKLFMKVIEPAKAVETKAGKEAYTATIKAVHRASDVAQLEWESQRNETMDMNMEQLKKWFDQFSEEENRDFFIAYAGRPGSIEAEQIQRKARKRLPDVLKQPKLVSAIREISQKNHKRLKEVVGDNIGWVEDYFYGLYKNPSMVFAKWKKSTKRFTKHKVIPSLADVINMGSEALHDNYIDNLKAEYMGIARLGAMTWLKSELMKTGKGRYIDEMGDAPVDWQSVKDPVFAGVMVQPDLALLINNLISTNKITQQPILNAFRKVGNFLRIVKFIGSIFHLRSEIQQSIADSGYLGFLYKKTGLRGFQALGTSTKKRWAKLRQTPEYKRLLELGIGHRYSYEQQAQKQFKDFVDKINSGNFIGATIRGAKIPLKIPARFTGWLFDQYIPMVKGLKVLDAQMEIEKKEGRPATDWEIINIIKETQNFYGEMNERLFGRSGTVTTGMRFIYLAPGFAEGNYRTILKSLFQWGQGEGWRAGRSRSNMVNSPLITATIATLGTLMLTGKQPKKPENLEDVRDIFKIDTGKKDKRGRKVMIDMMTYDKDYWNIYFNVLRGRPDTAVYESLRRLGGMKAPMFDMALDFLRMSTGQAIYDWKGDRVTEITDTWLEKLMKIAIHEIKKTEPIPMSVFRQARKKETDKIISFVEAVAGVRPTLTEKDKREGEILRRCWSLKGQKEEMYVSLATLDRPRAGVKWYNNKVKDVLESKLVPKSMKDEWIPKLTIDLEKYLQNKALDASRLPTTKDSEEQIEKAVKILKNFDISPNSAEQLLMDYYKRPKAKTVYRPIESDRILGRARKKKRLKERMQ